MLESVSENMTSEDIEQSEKDIESLKKMLKYSFGIQDRWEKNGIEYDQIDSSAKIDIGLTSEKAWLKNRREKFEGYQKELENAVETINKAKEKLKKKQA